MHRTALLRSLGLALLLHAHAATSGRAGDLPVVADVEFQPLSAQVRRVAEALELLGEPLPDAVRARLDAATRAGDPTAGVGAIQAALDPLCLIGVGDQPREPRQGGPRPGRGPARAGRLAGLPRQGPQRGGRHRRTQGREPERRPALQAVDGSPEPAVSVPASEVPGRWMDVAMSGDRPLNKALSGLALEYRVILLYSRDAGQAGGQDRASTSVRGRRTSASAATSTSSSTASPRPRSRSRCSTSTAGRRRPRS